ncbi:hypothetical protein KRP22_003501 [Phytophthora ramorum]|uniref:uncharacterized protein n=1 Tax=Phytophthora ramorum TaxID=164328 RepID=UPI0030977323|nr:hypothetical protein KRP23_8943 [Phytophthora ramorum]KAH7500176.1 hypothetical protein KRP22_9434 [Phytophthora ramorum]
MKLQGEAVPDKKPTRAKGKTKETQLKAGNGSKRSGTRKEIIHPSTMSYNKGKITQTIKRFANFQRAEAMGQYGILAVFDSEEDDDKDAMDVDNDVTESDNMAGGECFDDAPYTYADDTSKSSQENQHVGETKLATAAAVQAQKLIRDAVPREEDDTVMSEPAGSLSEPPQRTSARIKQTEDEYTW